MKKMLIIAVLCIAALLLTVITGDYYGLWGQTNINKLDIENIHFRASDSVSGAPVINYHIRCSGQGSNDICSTGKDESSPLGEKTIKIGINRQYRKGLIFKHQVTSESDATTNLRIWVLHTDYQTLTLDVNSEELLQFRTQPKQLQLTPKFIEADDG
ncbi:MAG: hypothetical protein ACR2P9_00085 [Gammaproteobacteria bacterium]